MALLIAAEQKIQRIEGSVSINFMQNSIPKQIVVEEAAHQGHLGHCRKQNDS